MACRKKLKQSSMDIFLACPALQQPELSLRDGQTSLCPQNLAELLSSSSRSVDSSSSFPEEQSFPGSPNDGPIGFPEAAPLANKCLLDRTEEDLIADVCVSPIVTYRRKRCMPEVAELQNHSQKRGPLNTSFIAEEFNKSHESCSLLGGYCYKKCFANPIFDKNTFNRKKICGQYFLDLGQADFSYTTCKMCGLVYACGHENDEKLHATFHKSYLQGIQFKGWLKERVVMKFNKNGDRIILVLPTDPPHCQLKVREVATIMEKELGLVSGWLLHSQSKVLFFISSKKVIGCIVAESIKQAYPVFPEKGQDAVSQEDNYPQVDKTLSHLQQDCCHEKAKKPVSKILMFGNVNFEREVQKRSTFKSQDDPINFGRAVICSNIPVHALCGVRGIWVSRKDRRRGIATKLLDAMRASFLYGFVVDSSQCAFSQPTPDGKAFAARYCKTESFLVYS